MIYLKGVYLFYLTSNTRASNVRLRTSANNAAC